MRLVGRREILAYLGRRVDSKGSWRVVRARYATVIRRDGPRYVWTTSEELDALDRERCPSVATDGTDLGVAERRRAKRVKALGYRVGIRHDAG